jgi:hypothetical protein
MYESQVMEGNAGDFIIFPKGSEIIGEAVNEFVYLTVHFPPLDVLIEEREKQFGLKNKMPRR